MVLAWAIGTARSIQIGVPACASASMPGLRSQGVRLSAIRRTSTPRSRARTSASTMPEPSGQIVGADQDLPSRPVDRPTAKAAQSSSGAKHTAIVAPGTVAAAGNAAEPTLNAKNKAVEITYRRISGRN